jgi:hypothetical protein
MSAVWGEGEQVQVIHPGAACIAGRELVSLGCARVPAAVRAVASHARTQLNRASTPFSLSPPLSPPPQHTHTHTQVIESWRAVLRGVRPNAFKLKLEDVRVFALSDSHGLVTCVEVIEADDSTGRCARMMCHVAGVGCGAAGRSTEHVRAFVC